MGGESPPVRSALQTADRETVEIIAEIFLETWPRDIERLRLSAAKEDIATFERTAHSLKGTLGTFAADPAVRTAADLEVLARQEDLAELLGDDVRSEMESNRQRLQELAGAV